MAGLSPISLIQISGIDGRPQVGAKASFTSATTLSAITVYQDYALTIPHPNPVSASASGIFPPIYIDEDVEFYRLRITTSGGAIIQDLTTLPVIGPNQGGGGGGGTTVDPTALYGTRDVKIRFDDQPLDGYVRMNGNSVGNAVSGATERANSDCQSLFEELWPFTNIVVPSGKGANATADWNAGKVLTLPDMQYRAPIGLGGMGGTDATRISSSTIPGPTVAGAVGGVGSQAITQAELPVITPTGTISEVQPSFVKQAATFGHEGGDQSVITDVITGPSGGTTVPTSSDTPTFTGDAFGSGNALSRVQPSMMLTFYLKL
jgi:hypothetical protein